MWNTIKSILGSSEVISSGMTMLDEAFDTSQEKGERALEAIKVKAKAKISLMKAYAPFKLAQRYFMLVMLFNFTLSFLVGLGVVTYNMFSEVIISLKPLLELIKVFGLFEITMLMATFYFGGGVIDSVGRRFKKGK